MISDREKEDFEAAILEAGFEVDDFSVVDMEHEPTAKEPHPITGTVTVHRISTDDFITYRAGSGSIWPQEFKADLQAGKFGQP